MTVFAMLIFGNETALMALRNSGVLFAPKSRCMVCSFRSPCSLLVISQPGGCSSEHAQSPLLGSFATVPDDVFGRRRPCGACESSSGFARGAVVHRGEPRKERRRSRRDDKGRLKPSRRGEPVSCEGHSGPFLALLVRYGGHAGTVDQKSTRAHHLAQLAVWSRGTPL